MHNLNSLFTFKGKVKSHLGRGKKLGFPTANIDIDKEIPEGIYIGFTHIDSQKLPSLIFIGAPKTFEETDKKAESYILDFSEDIYGKLITLEVLKKIRDNKKFVNEKELIEQMKEDEKQAREYFLNNES